MIHPNVLFVFHGVVTRVMCTPPSTIDDDDDDDDALGGPRDDERWRRWVCATSFCGRGEEEAKDTLFVSVAAGVTLKTMESVWTEAGDQSPAMIRVMPNTPCLVGAAASGLCEGSTCTEAHRNSALALMSSVGICKVILENQMSALTGVSGSGPAYVFILIEGMSDGGVRAGLPRDVATQLAAQTFYGAAKMVLETGKHPGVLKDSVCSPGGTTIAAVHALEQAGVRQAMMNAVVAAAERGDELAKAAAGK